MATCSEKSNFMAMVCTCTGVDLYCFHSRIMPESPEEYVRLPLSFFPGYSLDFFSFLLIYGGLGVGFWGVGLE